MQMRFLPLVAKPGIQGLSSSDAVFTGSLPAFYMNDYSVMGLRVSDCDAAFALLADRRYAVTHRQGGRGVAIRSAADIQRIVGLLAKNGLDAEVADVAEQIYQG